MEQPQFNPNIFQSSATKRTLSGRERRHPSNNFVLPERTGPAVEREAAPLIPHHLREAVYALTPYDDQQILYWLAFARQSGRNSIDTSSINSQPVSIASTTSSGFNPRASIASSNSQFSRISSVFSEAQPRPFSAVSASTFNTNFSNRSQPQIFFNHEFPGSKNNQGSAGSTAGASRGKEQSKEKKYICTNCETKFSRKWDWKHHEEEYHEQWRKWNCPDCGRGFYSENKFKQHHKSAHECSGKCSHANGAFVSLAKRVAWGCGFCGALCQDWEGRIEHIATHYEEGKTKADWNYSSVIYGLLQQPDIKKEWKNLVLQKQGYFSFGAFKWDKKDLGPALDKLEYTRHAEEIEELVDTIYRLGSLPQRQSSQRSVDKPLPRPPLDSGAETSPVETERKPSETVEPASEPADCPSTEPCPSVKSSESQVADSSDSKPLSSASTTDTPQDAFMFSPSPALGSGIVEQRPMAPTETWQGQPTDIYQQPQQISQDMAPPTQMAGPFTGAGYDGQFLTDFSTAPQFEMSLPLPHTTQTHTTMDDSQHFVQPDNQYHWFSGISDFGDGTGSFLT